MKPVQETVDMIWIILRACNQLSTDVRATNWKLLYKTQLFLCAHALYGWPFSIVLNSNAISNEPYSYNTEVSKIKSPYKLMSVQSAVLLYGWFDVANALHHKHFQQQTYLVLW